MNVVILSGNLARDPEVRSLASGQAICDASIAVNKRWKTESGDEKERVAFVGLVIWGKRGEAFARFNRKGSKVLVRGELVQEVWEDKETGKKREKTKVQVEDWEFAGSRRDGEQQPAAPKSKILPTEADAPQPPEDDVPF